MHFFSQYKDLFGVPQGLVVPSSRLRIDNQLFIERSYLPAKSQEYSLNGKLRQLKKDYLDFEHQMEEITTMKQTPKRSKSRKGKEQALRSSFLSSQSNENKDLRSPKPLLPPAKRPASRQEYQLQKERMLSDAMKRESWLQDEQSNILKHSELDHLFSGRLNRVYDLDEIKPSTLPRPEHLDPMGHSLDSKRAKGNFTIKQRSRPQLGVKAGVEQRQGGAENVAVRRQKAKDSLQFRRKKLQQLLRTLW